MTVMTDETGHISNMRNKIVSNAEQLASNPKYALSAIRSRNVRIKALKAEINHRKIADEEISERADAMAIANEKLSLNLQELIYELNKEKDAVNELKKEKEKLKGYLNTFENTLIAIQTELSVKQEIEKSGWVYKVKELFRSLPQWTILGPILAFLLTPPASRYLVVFIISILLIASFIGWPALVVQLKLIFSLFGG